MNSWWEWSIMNCIIPFWIVSLTKQSLKRSSRLWMCAQEEKGKKEILPPVHGRRRYGTWSAFHGCNLCSFSRVGKFRLVQSCSVAVLPHAALWAALQEEVSVAGLCTTGTQLASWPAVHQHFCATKSHCLVPPNWNWEFGPLGACQKQIHSFSFPCHQS